MDLLTSGFGPSRHLTRPKERSSSRANRKSCVPVNASRLSEKRLPLRQIDDLAQPS